MYDSLELFSAFGNVAFAALALLASALTFTLSAWFVRAPRRAALAASLTAALVTAAALTASAAHALRTLGDASVEVERADATKITSLRRWTVAQQRRIALASMSPLHRGAVRRLFERPLRFEEPFPPADPASLARLRAWTRARGECGLDALLDRRDGDFERAASTPCARPDGARQAAEAALATGDVERAWSLIATSRAAVHDGFDARLLTLLARPPSDALATLPAVPAHERPAWACVMERLRQRALGDRDVEVWTPLLASDSAACRILAATAPARRDAASLRALSRLPIPAQRAWRTQLTASRVVIALSGRLDPVPCLSRRIAAVDAAWLARYPSIAEDLLRDARDEGCAFVMDRVWFPAMQSVAWNAWGDPERPSMEPFEDLIVGWQLVDGAWDRMHTLLDPRFTRSKRAQLERAFRNALGPVSSWAVARLDVAWAGGEAWSGGFSWPSVMASLDALPRREGWDHEPMLRAHDIPHYAVRLAKRWDLDVARVPAHNPVLDAWVDYWRTGTFAPAHDAPPWLRDASMLRVAAAADEGDARDVLRALGDPTIQHAEQLAVVAYRLRGDTARFEPWLRRAWGSLDPFAAPLATWEDALQTLRTCALRLRIAGLRRDVEAALVRVRALRHDRDGFIQAVLDGPRPAPPPTDDDAE
jgi:hypothetical protein